MEAFIGTILPWPMNWAPQGWAMCNGQLLNINQHSAVFALLGTYFGGNGNTTFALPDLRGRVPVGMGQGPGLSNMVLGQTGGAETVTLTAAQMPAHTHGLVGVLEEGNSNSPKGNYPANTKGVDTDYAASGTTTPMAAGAIATSGGGQAHNNMQPFMGMNYIICLQGIFPSRP